MTARDFQAALALLALAPRPFAAAALGVSEKHWSTMVYRGTNLTPEQEAALRAGLRTLADGCRALAKQKPVP